MVHIEVSERDQVTLLIVSGRVDSNNAEQLGEALVREIDQGKTSLVLDLSGVDYMSSAGLRELVSAYKRAQNEKGDLRIAQPSARVLELLEVAGLDSVFQIYSTPTEAVGSF